MEGAPKQELSVVEQQAIFTLLNLLDQIKDKGSMISDLPDDLSGMFITLINKLADYEQTMDMEKYKKDAFPDHTS